MSVPNSNYRVQFTLTSATQTLAVPFYFLEDSHLKVINVSEGLDVLTISTDYTVTGAGDEAGGSIILTGAATSIGDKITIKRSVPLDQLIDYIYNDRFPAKTHEKGLDKLTMLLQQLQEQIDRALRFEEGEVLDGELTIADRAGGILGFDEDGNIEWVDKAAFDADVASALAAATAALASANNAAASALAAAAYSPRIVFDTVADMSAASVTSYPDGVAGLLLGYYSRGDGGGGIVYLEKTSSATVDSGVTFTATTGRWIRHIDGEITSKQFGLKSDWTAGTGGTDNTARLQAMIDYAEDTAGVGISLSAGFYGFDSYVTITNKFGSYIKGAGRGIEAGSGAAKGATVLYRNGAGPMFLCLAVTRATFRDFAVRHEPKSSLGWADPAHDVQPRTDDTSYTFYAVGNFYLNNISNILTHTGSGFYRGVDDVTANADLTLALSVSGGECITFQNDIRSIYCSFGRVAIEIADGAGPDGNSGGTWTDIYITNSAWAYESDGTTRRPVADLSAVSAIVYGAGASSESEQWQRVNVEWCNFTGPVLDMEGCQLINGLHLEGLTFNSSGGATATMITLQAASKGILIFNNINIISIFQNDASVTRLNLVKASGLGAGHIIFNGGSIRDFTGNWAIHRVASSVNHGGGFVDFRDTRFKNIAFAASSASLMGYDSGWATNEDRYGLTDDFVEVTDETSGPFASNWRLSTANTPPALTYLADPDGTLSSPERVGVMHLQTGTTNLMKQWLSLPYARFKVGSGTIRMKWSIRCTQSATSGVYTLGIGFVNDNETDLMNATFYTYKSSQFDSIMIDLEGATWKLRSDTSTTSGTTATIMAMAADTWYEFELLIGHDGTKLFAWERSNGEGGRNEAADVLTSNIPTGVTLIPSIYLSKGSGGSGTSIYIDKVQVSFSPNKA